MPARHIIAEHYRLKSSMAILSRSFYDSWLAQDETEIDRVFKYGISEIREYEERLKKRPKEFFEENRKTVIKEVKAVKKQIHISRMASCTDEDLEFRHSIDIHKYSDLEKLALKFGDSFYLLYVDRFIRNYEELFNSFRTLYPLFNIAYSYKTNYIPELCKSVNKLGGYAEIVSQLELENALRCGVDAKKIIWNGPIKKIEEVKWLLLNGGTVNVDSLKEMEDIKKVLLQYPEKTFNLGIRCNFDVGDGIQSRFGTDISSKEFHRILQLIRYTENIKFSELHCHFAKRDVRYWKKRTQVMLDLFDSIREVYAMIPERIDIGGGIYGKMPEFLRQQLKCETSDFTEYALESAKLFAEHFPNTEGPELLIEPGTALAGDCMDFVCRVYSIKNVRGRWIACVSGSQKNINMTDIKPPIRIIHDSKVKTEKRRKIDIAGYTCIENDYLYHQYNGSLSEGDFVFISNCGSYSVVMKPPFIMPNVPILSIGDMKCRVVKRAEKFDDLFSTYRF